MITIRRFNTIINKLRLPAILWSTASTNFLDSTAPFSKYLK